jgi:predicted transcriptional regulator
MWVRGDANTSPTHQRERVRPMKLTEIARILDATLLVGEDKLGIDITRCGASDLMSDILAGPSEGSLLLTGLTTVQVIRTASIAGVSVIVFVRGKTAPPEVLELARAGGMPLMSAPHSMFVSCGRLHAHGLIGLNGRR